MTLFRLHAVQLVYVFVNDELVRTRKDVVGICCKIIFICLPGASEAVAYQGMTRTCGLPNASDMFIYSTTTFTIQHNNNIKLAVFTEFDPK
jgi:hypothetical protein